MSVTRRTVVRGAAWSVPVVAIAAQAPAFAASTCLPVPAITGWSSTSSAASTFQALSGANGFSTDYASDGINRYLSERDSSATNAVATNATISLSTPITGLTVGTTYSITFHLVSRFANDDVSAAATSQVQGVRATLGSTVLFSRQKRKASNAVNLSGYTDLSNSPVIAGGSKVKDTIVVNYTATASSTTLTYLFTLPGRNNSFAAGSADIAISAPVFSNCP